VRARGLADTTEGRTAHGLIGEFYEDNARKWKSAAHRAVDGRIVVTVMHLGRVDWRNPAADPSGLVRNALDTARSAQ
ncbi:hypothetical protein, partial [Sphingomonas faeni]|uniref:hypothetical protein n=1 Tax=Sphingomonas faeni TaxID=185950 RepID=UPI0020C773E7